MYSLAKPFAGRILLCLFLILFATSIQLSLPLGIRYIFDRMLQSNDASIIHGVAGILLVVFVIRSVLSFFGQFMLQVMGDSIVIELRSQLFQHLQKLELDFHQRHNTGELLSRLNNDVGAIRTIIANVTVVFAMNIFQLVGATAIMVYMNWKLSLVVLAVGPLTTIASAVFGPIFRKLSSRVQDELAQSSIIAQESLSGIEMIKGFGRGQHETLRYRSRLSHFMGVVISARRTDAFFNSLIAFLTSTSTIAIFWYGGTQVMAGALSAGTLVAFLLYSQNITQSIAAIAQQYSGLNQAIGSSRRVFEILDTKPAIENREDGIEFEGPDVTLRIDNLEFGYLPSRPVLSGISLTVEPGQTIALVGHSGSGKSTILKLIQRLYDPTLGAIFLNGRDLRDYDTDSLTNSMSVVSQDVFLFGHSVRENIRYGRLAATDEEVEEAAKAANAHDFIGQLPEGYDTKVGERGVKLSGGQRQRIAIARAILKNAPLLLLDEATSAVDNLSETLIQQAIDRVKANRTTVVIAHRLATIRNADRIYVVSGGRIVACPSYNELIEGDHSFLSDVRNEPAPGNTPSV